MIGSSSITIVIGLGLVFLVHALKILPHNCTIGNSCDPWAHPLKKKTTDNCVLWFALY